MQRAGIYQQQCTSTMASIDSNEEVVSQALLELSLSRGDQENLCNFLTDYFGTTELEDPGIIGL